MRVVTRLTSFCVSMLCVTATVAQAHADETPPGRNAGLFYVHAAAGGAVASISETSTQGEPPNEVEVEVAAQGLGFGGETAVGIIVAPEVAAHASAWGWSAGKPSISIKVDGTEVASGDAEGAMSFAAVGVGATMVDASGIFASGSLGVGSLTLTSASVDPEVDPEEKTSDPGSRTQRLGRKAVVARRLPCRGSLPGDWSRDGQHRGVGPHGGLGRTQPLGHAELTPGRRRRGAGRGV